MNQNKNQVDDKSVLFKMAIFIILIIVGIMILSISSLFILMASGMSFSEIQQDPTAIQNLDNPAILRITLFLNQVFMFLIPSLCFGWFFYRKELFSKFMLNKSPWIIHILLGIALLISATPLVNAAFILNGKLPLAEWMVSTEQDVAALLSKILDTTNPLVYLANILLIAVTPAIAEELVFRGIIQRYTEKLLTNGHLAVWVSAIIFSLIHFQFEGFLPRVVLGAVLGYAYLWTRNLWVPIIMHFLNNLLPILVLIILGDDITDTSNIEAEFNIWWLIPSIIAVVAIGYLFTKTFHRSEDRQES